MFREIIVSYITEKQIHRAFSFGFKARQDINNYLLRPPIKEVALSYLPELLKDLRTL